MFSSIQKKIIAALLVVTIIAPAGLFLLPSQAEAGCDIGGGGGGEGGSSGGSSGGGTPTPSGPAPGGGAFIMSPTPARFVIKRVTTETPLSFGGSFDTPKGARINDFLVGASSALKNASPIFDYHAPTVKGDLAEGMPVIDAVLAALQQIGNAISKITSLASCLTSLATDSLKYKELVLDPIAWGLANQIIADMLNDVQRWAVSGFKGNPVFLQNPKKYFEGLADDALGQFLNTLGGVNFCGPWGPNIRLALDINLGYRQRAQCSFSGIVAGFNAFSNNFSNGGWSAFLQLTTMTQNNPYGAYLLASDEAARRIGTMPQGVLGRKTLELSWGKGVISMTKCRVSADTNGDCIDEAGNVDPSDTVVTTPGNIIENSINSALDMPNQRIVAADEINETLSALLYGLVTKAFSSNQGFAGANSAWVPRSPYGFAASGSFESVKAALLDFIISFVDSESNYKRQKESSFSIVKEGGTALQNLALCYQDEINLNNQYESEILRTGLNPANQAYTLGVGNVYIQPTNYPFSGFSVSTAETKKQNAIDITSQNITPRLSSFQNAITSSAVFITEIGNMMARTTAATTLDEVNNLNTLFSSARGRWHNEINAAQAQNEVDDTRRAISPITTQANTDLAACSVARQSMEAFLRVYGLTPISTTPGKVHIRATINGNPVTATTESTQFVIGFTAPTPSLNNPNFTTNASSTYSNSPIGSYTVGYVSGAPAGVSFQNITPAATQILNGGGDITFTFNFTSP